MAFAALTIDLNARLAKFEQDMARANKSLDGLSTRANAAAAGLKTAFGALAGTLAVGTIAAFAKSGIDAADSLNDMSQRLGVSVKDLASFKLAAEQSGTSLDGIGNGIRKLSLSIGQAEQGLKTQADALKTLGITARDPKEAFFQLADAVANSNDPIKTNAALNDVLGRSYAELLPLLNQGSGALRESARQSETFADAMARLAPEADAFNDNLALLKNNAAGFASELLSNVVPALNQFAERMSTIRAAIGAGGLFASLNLTGTVKSDLNIVQGEIAQIESTIARLRKNSGGLDSSIAPLTNQLANLQKVRAALIDIAVRQGNAPPPRVGANSPAAGGGNLSNTRTGRAGARVSDPLASLLGSTEIGKLAEFDKQVALLNARFDGGRKNAELYTQAMTKLVETTFAGNFTEYNRQLAEQEETQRAVADHLKATNDALFEQNQAWTEAGRALEEEMRTPLENANIELGRLQELLDRGVISFETFSRATFKLQEGLEGSTKKLSELDNFAKTAAENIQNSFADFLFDPFKDGLDGMLKGFGQTIQRMIADAVAADLARYLFGDLVQGGSGSGVAGGILSAIGGLFGGARADGGPVISGRTYLVGERGPELFTPGGSGSITPNNALRGMSSGHSITVIVQGGQSAPDVRRAAGQGAREALMAFNGAQRYA